MSNAFKRLLLPDKCEGKAKVTNGHQLASYSNVTQLEGWAQRCKHSIGQGLTAGDGAIQCGIHSLLHRCCPGVCCIVCHIDGSLHTTPQPDCGCTNTDGWLWSVPCLAVMRRQQVQDAARILPGPANHVINITFLACVCVCDWHELLKRLNAPSRQLQGTFPFQQVPSS